MVSKQIASSETEMQHCYTQAVSELLDYTVFRVDLLLGCECGMKEMQPLKHHGEWLGWDEAWGPGGVWSGRRFARRETCHFDWLQHATNLCQEERDVWGINVTQFESKARGIL